MNQHKYKQEVERSTYKKRSILNSEEIKVYFALVEMVRCFEGYFYIYPQVNLGEIISSNTDIGHSAINSKRVDFCISNRSFEPIAVVEYQGGGHFQNDAKVRDEIKHKAVTKAGIHYEAIYESELNSVKNLLNSRLKPVLQNANKRVN